MMYKILQRENEQESSHLFSTWTWANTVCHQTHRSGNLFAGLEWDLSKLWISAYCSVIQFGYNENHVLNLSPEIRWMWSLLSFCQCWFISSGCTIRHVLPLFIPGRRKKIIGWWGLEIKTFQQNCDENRKEKVLCSYTAMQMNSVSKHLKTNGLLLVFVAVLYVCVNIPQEYDSLLILHC